MSRLADTREWTDPRGWDLPPHLALRISEPASNVVDIRTRNRVLYVPGMNPYDQDAKENQ